MSRHRQEEDQHDIGDRRQEVPHELPAKQAARRKQAAHQDEAKHDPEQQQGSQENQRNPTRGVQRVQHVKQSLRKRTSPRPAVRGGFTYLAATASSAPSLSTIFTNKSSRLCPCDRISWSGPMATTCPLLMM